MSKRLTTQEFILKSISKHGNKYDYSNTEYVNEKSLISIGYKIVSVWESDFKKINNRLCQ
jgi:hypothetical protein